MNKTKLKTELPLDNCVSCGKEFQPQPVDDTGELENDGIACSALCHDYYNEGCDII